MKLDVLLSAMYLKDQSILEKLNISSNVIVINQCDEENDYTHINAVGKNIRFISTKERGLSKSRNMAIDNSDADICILCDNDVKYHNDYEKIIVSAFEKYKDADICVFFIRRPERTNPLTTKECDLGYLKAMKIFSPEIAFKRKSISDLRFNEEFGAGAKYGMGEENIFLWQAKKSGLKIKYIPTEIAQTIPNESTWFKGYTNEFFRNRGAGYYAMSQSLWWVLCLQFAIRKIKLYRNDNSFFNALKYMYLGKVEYKKSI